MTDGPASEQPVADNTDETPGTPAPAAQDSEQTAVQSDRYWQGTHDKLVNSQEYKDAQALYDLYKQTPGLLESTKKFLETGDEPAKGTNDDFDASIDFDLNEAFTNPASKSAQFFNQAVQKAAEPMIKERVGKLEVANQRNTFRDRFLGIGIPKDEVDGLIDNFQNPSDTFIFEQLAPLVAANFKRTAQQAPQPAPGGSNLDSVRETQAGPAVTGPVQGAASAAKSETDSLWDGITSQTQDNPFE